MVVGCWKLGLLLAMRQKGIDKGEKYDGMNQKERGKKDTNKKEKSKNRRKV
jgi:hypothetical protein